jgi:hypothetical protein
VSDRRGLRREEAADYLSLSLAGFDAWVAQGLIPGPIPGTKRWDRKAIDLALDRASGLESPSPFEEWKRGRRAHEGQDARR